MLNLSRSNFFHSLLNRKYNFIIKLIFGFSAFLICFLLTFDFRISNFFFRNISQRNDLKNEARRLFWLFKITFLNDFLSLDMMYDFCHGLDFYSILYLKRKLEKKIKRINSIFLKLDLLKIMAHQINYVDLSSENNGEILNNFRDYYFEIKSNILNKKNYQILKKAKKKQKINKSKSNHNIEKTLHDINTLFESSKVEWFPIAGTLLGLIREGRLLENDLDIDIGIMEGTISIEILKKLISKSTFFKVSRVEYQKDFLTEKNILKPIFARLVHSNGINVDIFLHYFSGEKINHGTSSLLWENKTFKLKSYKSENSLMKIPDNPEQYLTETYGNWKVEKKDYNYHRDMPSLTGARNYLGIEYLLRSYLFCGRLSEKKIVFLEELLL